MFCRVIHWDWPRRSFGFQDLSLSDTESKIGQAGVSSFQRRRRSRLIPRGWWVSFSSSCCCVLFQVSLIWCIRWACYEWRKSNRQLPYQLEYPGWKSEIFIHHQACLYLIFHPSMLYMSERVRVLCQTYRLSPSQRSYWQILMSPVLYAIWWCFSSVDGGVCRFDTCHIFELVDPRESWICNFVMSVRCHGSSSYP